MKLTRQPLTFVLSPRQMSDATAALALLDALPPVRMLPRNNGCDADWFR
ncbi:hypothetical protein [Rhodovulum sulfidophilum]|uniref:Uncharacterized protein n=1 Tax=Rhodovulum sulfidophilum TaxID=35806 RepID=A0ABS1RY98_RHOSU|nr:hypothetical protein [Rhodovulum sulfidophilum]MBL3611073.1 hypothetical protein [Rhodovulum sulfidophilum]MCE8458148.1 hypothetical protein [Rhodovulum sulfidophilum]